MALICRTVASDIQDPKDLTTCSFQVVRIWKDKAVSCKDAEVVLRIKAVITLKFFNKPFYSAVQWMPKDLSLIFIRQL